MSGLSPAIFPERRRCLFLAADTNMEMLHGTRTTPESQIVAHLFRAWQRDPAAENPRLFAAGTRLLGASGEKPRVARRLFAAGTRPRRGY